MYYIYVYIYIYIYIYIIRILYFCIGWVTIMCGTSQRQDISISYIRNAMLCNVNGQLLRALFSTSLARKRDHCLNHNFHAEV